ncbi:DUF4118 domain-containing protein [Dactylosporangium sp. CA-233914]|uniref:sensor histidine kinase n=1 Tax=Dactylosporangium sp. CA-233914 TaxID=3239934 RepID=UPI003D916024
MPLGNSSTAHPASGSTEPRRPGAVRGRLESWLLPAKSPPLGLGLVVAAAVVALETAGVEVLHTLHPASPPHVELYLLGVLALTIVWGARIGVVTALASTVVFNYFEIPPAGLHLTLHQDLERLVIFLVVALGGSALASVARSHAVEAQQRAEEADVAAGLARIILGHDDPQPALGAGSRYLAARFGLPWTRIELDDGHPPGDAAGGLVLDLTEGQHRLARLRLPYSTPPAVRDRLRDRLGPPLVAILRTALDRQDLIRTLRASQRRTGALLAQQGALRRVATMVAAGGPPAEVFAAVTAELHHLFRGFSTALVRYQPDRTAAAFVSERDEHGHLRPVGPGLPVAGENIVSTIERTGGAARVDYATATGPIAERARARGFRCGAGVPIVVEGELWGVALIMSTRPDSLPSDAEVRLQAFTGLVATAIANAENRGELIASRRRLVTAADEARRRIERDLHDGAQQRIVSLALGLRMAEGTELADQPAARRLLSSTVQSLTEIHQDLSELARGIHPALLTQGGICPVLRALARRSPVPVELDVRVKSRLPERVEVAVYYVVSESLTNVVKHARATLASVIVAAQDERVMLSVRDDGVGGARCGTGTGIIGLRDRVEALGGRLSVRSPLGEGTTVTAEIPVGDVHPAAGSGSRSAPQRVDAASTR